MGTNVPERGTVEIREVERADVPEKACADCGKDIREAGGYATYGEGAVKCDACYEKDPLLRPRCEVYSRVTGYLRPVENWNPGKQAEWQDRRMLRPDSWD